MKTVITTPDAPAALGPYSQAIRNGGFLFVSGQLGLDPKTGNLVSSDVVGQATQALENLRAVLKAAGATPEDVVKTTVFLVNMGDFAAVNEIYARTFTTEAPARSCVAVASLPKGALVEIEAMAVI